MRGMPSIHRRGAVACAAALIVILAHARIAFGGTLRVDVRAGVRFDVAAFSAAALRYHIHVHRAVAADIDHDGDLDVVAATDTGVLVWVNDGFGRLTSQPPTRPLGIEAQPSGAEWRGGESHVEETIQTPGPHVPVPDAYAHAPPTLVAAFRVPVDSSIVLAAPPTYGAPRAPPA